MKILLTGGAGYIGSHVLLSIIENKHEVVVIDELGCAKMDSFIISQNDDIYIDFSLTSSTCKDNADGQIELYIGGGVEPYNIFLNSELISSNSSSYLNIEDLLSNTYNIEISDAYNCIADTTLELDFDGGYNCIKEPIIITPNADNFNDEWIPIKDLDVNIEVNILNRWGQKEYVYKGNSLSFRWNGLGNWGGTRDLVSADYYYIIKFNNDDYPDKTGVITLIR